MDDHSKSTFAAEMTPSGLVMIFLFENISHGHYSSIVERFLIPRLKLRGSLGFLKQAAQPLSIADSIKLMAGNAIGSNM